MRQGLGLGIGAGSGFPPPLPAPAIPQAANVIRAWSLRRLIDGYKGAGVRHLPSDGGSETDAKFKRDGTLNISGATAYANSLYDQKCGVACKLVQSTFAACPEVFSQTEGLRKGVRFISSQFLQMADIDTAVDTLLTDITTGHTVSLWVRFSTVVGNAFFLMRRSTNAGYLRFMRVRNDIRMLHRNIPTTGTIHSEVAANTWYHIVLTCKGANGENGLKTYINAATPVVQDIKAVNGGTTLMSIGDPSSTNTGYTEVNDLMFWNRELGADEVLALFNAQAPYYGVSAK